MPEGDRLRRVWGPLARHPQRVTRDPGLFLDAKLFLSFLFSELGLVAGPIGADGATEHQSNIRSGSDPITPIARRHTDMIAS